MKKVLIAGGAGFIGSHIAKHLLKNFDAEIIIFDNFTSGTHSHLVGVKESPRVTVVSGDIKDLELLASAMTGVDTVFHTAANPDIAKAATHPDIDFWEGTYLTNNILEAMRIKGARCIYYTSGSGVYGEDPGIFFSEDHGPCNPISTYGASKLACEALISSYVHMFGIKGRIFRFANVVGPRQTHGVGFDFLRKLATNPLSLQILGNGQQLKSYIHVSDVISALFMVHKTIPPEEKYTVFNVSTTDYITVSEIADLAIQVAGLDVGRVEKIFTGGDRGWKGDVPVIKFNSEKLRALGWHNKYTSAAAMLASLESMVTK